MQKKYTTIYIVILCLLFMSFNSQYLNQSLSEDTRISEKRVECNLISPDNDTSIIYIEYELYVKTDSSFKDSINSMIKGFYIPYDASEEEINKSLSHTLFSDYLKQITVDYYEYLERHDTGTRWSFNERVFIYDSFSTIAEVHYSGWSYMGGAHSNDFSYIYILDKEDGRKLQLSDFFSDIPELTKIVEPYFRDQNLLEKDKNLSLHEAGYDFGEDGLELNNNFSFSNRRISFLYNRYEIGPYPLPPSEVIVPLCKIQHLLIREI